MGPWRADEDQALLEAQIKFGNRWNQIAKILPGRTENAVKNRFNSVSFRRWKDAVEGCLELDAVSGSSLESSPKIKPMSCIVDELSPSSLLHPLDLPPMFPGGADSVAFSSSTPLLHSIKCSPSSSSSSSSSSASSASFLLSNYHEKENTEMLTLQRKRFRYSDDHHHHHHSSDDRGGGDHHHSSASSTSTSSSTVSNCSPVNERLDSPNPSAYKHGGNDNDDDEEDEDDDEEEEGYDDADEDESSDSVFISEDSAAKTSIHPIHQQQQQQKLSILQASSSPSPRTALDNMSLNQPVCTTLIAAMLTARDTIANSTTAAATDVAAAAGDHCQKLRALKEQLVVVQSQRKELKLCENELKKKINNLKKVAKGKGASSY
jgi:hypothetical protein